MTIVMRFSLLTAELWWPFLHGRVVAVLKRRKHKMEFKDCQAEQKGLAFVEKD